jgi:hypothetical protein
MNEANLKVLIQQELPQILAQDPLVRDFILRTVSDYYASKPETESRFDRVLNELERDRQEQAQKWDEQNRKWEKHNRKWEEFTQAQAQKWDEQNRKWEEHNRKWEEFTQAQAQKWDEQNRKWEENGQHINTILSQMEINRQEQARKWDAQTRQNQTLLEEIRAMNRKHESTIGALGSRWGLHSEGSFRNALKGILEDSFGVQVLNLTDFDDAGEVFGRPDQVEIDVIIKNGTVIACEIKSSISKPEMYSFDRKVAFYQKRHQRPVSRKIVISPMVDSRALPVAEALGIEIYSYADTVENL